MVMHDGKAVHKNDYVNRAYTMWQDFDENEKAGCHFGMFPFAKMQAVEKEGYDSHKFCVALMTVAERNGGMRG
jgi:hypothetical protein